VLNKRVQAETWAKVYRYPVSNGVTAGCDEFDPTLVRTYDHSWIWSISIVRGTADYMLRMWRVWASVPDMFRAPRNWDREAEHNC